MLSVLCLCLWNEPAAVVLLHTGEKERSLCSSQIIHTVTLQSPRIIVLESNPGSDGHQIGISMASELYVCDVMGSNPGHPVRNA